LSSHFGFPSRFEKDALFGRAASLPGGTQIAQVSAIIAN
jgi:hypothetical protein